MLFKTPDPFSEGVNVSVEHRDGRGTVIWFCKDTAASPEDKKPIKSITAFKNRHFAAHIIPIINFILTMK